jgi:riboflavin-specific deaminase-like protein
VTDRPYVLMSCAMSVDGYIDDASDARLILSSEADMDRVDEVRAGCDAIMVGAGTIRRDDPRLVIRSAGRRARRTACGLPPDPVKVTVTATGRLDPAARFFTVGGSPRLVYCASPALAAASGGLSGLAEVIDAGDPPAPATIVTDLAERAVARLLLEGGGQLATEFLTAGLVDELHLVVAPLFVGDPAAPRFAAPGHYPHGPASRMRLAEVSQLGDVVLLRYLLDPAAADRRWLAEAVGLAKRCPPSSTAFSVGAVIVGADGTALATGFSREVDPHDHAEEAALAKLPPGDPRLARATLYSSLEPCGIRASRPHPCAELIIAAGIARVVYAWREPPLLAPGGGADLLRAAGVSVTQVPELAAQARQPNAHLTAVQPSQPSPDLP